MCACDLQPTGKKFNLRYNCNLYPQNKLTDFLLSVTYFTFKFYFWILLKFILLKHDSL